MYYKHKILSKYAPSQKRSGRLLLRIYQMSRTLQVVLRSRSAGELSSVYKYQSQCISLSF